MKNGCFYALLLILLSVATASIGKNFPVLHYTVENGLPSNTVYDVTKDHDDFLWFCTDKGLVRYDGITFEKFTTKDGLPDNEVFFTTPDYEGRIWICCYNGELCYYKDGIFHTAQNTPFLRLPFKPSFLLTINIEKDSSLTFVLKRDAHVINIRHEEMTCLNMARYKTAEFQNGLLDASKISNNRYLVLCEKNWYIVDTAGNIINTIRRKNDIPYHSTYSSKENYLYWGNGIYSMDTSETLQFRFTKKIEGGLIYKAYKWDTIYFIGTNIGLFINNDIQILNGNKISGVCRDVEGNYWATTLTNGVFCFNKDFPRLEQYTNVYHSKIAYAHATDKQVFYTTLNRNLYRLDRDKSVQLFDYYKNFRKDYPTEEEWKHFINFCDDFGNFIDDKNNYFHLDVPAVFMLSKINTHRPIFRLLQRHHYGVENIKETISKGDSIVFRHSYNLTSIDKKDLAHNGIQSLKKISRSTLGKRIFGVSFDDNGAIWYSTYESVKKTIGDITTTQKQFGDITFKWINIVHNYLVGISNKNQLVICTNFDKQISIKTYEGQDFIWDKLYKLNDSTFLVSTDKKYRLLHLYPSVDTPKTNVQVIENISLPVQAEYICSNDSFCYFFKNGSVTKIPVNNLFIPHLPPRIIFKEIRTKNAIHTIVPGLEIKYGESKYINISFRPFSFGGTDVICEYSISQNAGEYWRGVSNNEINLFDPGYGTYIVKVRARTLSGSFCAPYIFTFTILKPFWAAWWFIILTAVTFLAALSLIIRAIILQRTRKRELRHANEIRFLRSEYKALSALMNPHFIFNTLNNVQWLVNSGDNMAANQYLRVFSDLVRQNMHNISKELIPLRNEIELIKNYLKLEKLRFKNALNYEIHIEDNVDLDFIKVPPLLIQPLVENAIKHGLLPGTRTDNLLSIKIYRQHDKLCIDVSDNGVGINESQKLARNLHKSTGLENISNRIAKLSLMHDIHISLSVQDLRTEAGKVEGTLARICIDMQE